MPCSVIRHSVVANTLSLILQPRGLAFILCFSHGLVEEEFQHLHLILDLDWLHPGVQCPLRHCVHEREVVRFSPTIDMGG